MRQRVANLSLISLTVGMILMTSACAPGVGGSRASAKRAAENLTRKPISNSSQIKTTVDSAIEQTQYTPDSNIDHRRVPNLMTFFERTGKSVSITKRPVDYLPGDIVTWELDNHLLHIGLVTDVVADGIPNYLVVHNIGAGAKIEDVLMAWKIIGHYRLWN